MRQWIRVRVVPDGATELECGPAVQEMLHELQRREYLRSVTVDWVSHAGMPVFQMEVATSDAESARQFVLDEVFEVGGAFLPDIDEFSVDVLDSESLEPEEIWVSTPVLTVSHWPAHALVSASTLVFAFLSGLGFVTQQPLSGALFLAAFLACVWLVIAFGKTGMTSPSGPGATRRMPSMRSMTS